MKIIIADDHSIFRDTLEFMLNAKTQHSVIGAARNIADLKELLTELAADLVIIDYHMPEGDTIATADYIKQKYDNILLLFLTGSQSSLTLKHIISSRADGALHKEDDVQLIIEAINNINKNQKIISPTIQEKIVEEDFSLTSREFQTLSMIAQGYNSNEIADLLSISARTVEKHKQNIMTKMDVVNVAQLVTKAHHLQLLSQECGLLKRD